jgi:hypothetical protein
VPPAVWRQVQSDAQVGPLVAPIRARFELLESGRAPAVARLEFNLHVRERWQDRVRYAAHLARRAEAKERWQLPLAACFSCLYYLLRPVWLVGKSVAHRVGVGQRRKSPV